MPILYTNLPRWLPNWNDRPHDSNPPAVDSSRQPNAQQSHHKKAVDHINEVKSTYLSYRRIIW